MWQWPSACFDRKKSYSYFRDNFLGNGFKSPLSTIVILQLLHTVKLTLFLLSRPSSLICLFPTPYGHIITRLAPISLATYTTSSLFSFLAIFPVSWDEEEDDEHLGFHGSIPSYFPPSMMSSVGPESGNVQKQQMWYWETAAVNGASSAQIPITPLQQPVLDSNSSGSSNLSLEYYPYSSLPPTTNYFPFYSVQDYSYHHHHHLLQGQGTIFKREEGDNPFAPGSTIGLNLGRRTYFSAADAMAVDQLFRRTRGLYQHQVNQQVPRCQAEACKIDLSFTKHYHRRHKVCEFHSKATVVIVGDLQQRFCQQCSRFHVLAEFDEAKRSCRRRLADHNRRRRKPQPAASNNDNNSNNDLASTRKGSRTFSSGSSTISMETQKEDLSKATHMRNGPDLSLGGVGEEEKGAFVSQPVYQTSFVAMPRDENNQLQHFDSNSPPSSATIFHPHHNFFFSSSNEASQFTTAGGTGDHIAHGLFEVGFI